MSLEGLGALIQLESTRLEGARQTSQNFQQANSAVQQVGAQTAQAKTGIWTQKIEATYSKEVQEATVRKLESRLARERKAEQLAATIAMGVTGISALSNAWDEISDIVNKNQKLGDMPDYLKTPKIDPKGESTQVMTTPDPDDGNKSTVIATGKNPDGTYSAQWMTQGNDGSMTAPKSAVIGDYDVKSVLGNDPKYKELVKANGHDIPFPKLAQLSPELAMKVMKDKQHAMGRDESADFVAVLKANVPSNVARMDHNTPAPTPVAIADAKKSITDAIAEKNPVKSAAILAKLKDVSIEVDGKPVKVSDLKSEDLGRLKPDDLEKKLKDAAKMDAEKVAKLSGLTNPPPQNYSFIVSGNNVTMLDKDKNTSTTIKMNPAQAEAFRNKIKSKDESVLGEFLELDKNTSPENKTVASGVQESAKDFQMKVNSTTTYKAAVDSLKGSNILDKNHDSTFGKALDMVGDVGHAGFNFIINTAKDAAPYFQAYLSMKSKADTTEEELIEAKQKLAAENKKLKNIQMQIDLFNGRGS